MLPRKWRCLIENGHPPECRQVQTSQLKPHYVRLIANFFSYTLKQTSVVDFPTQMQSIPLLLRFYPLHK